MPLFVAPPEPASLAIVQGPALFAAPHSVPPQLPERQRSESPFAGHVPPFGMTAFVAPCAAHVFVAVQ